MYFQGMIASGVYCIKISDLKTNNTLGKEVGPAGCSNCIYATSITNDRLGSCSRCDFPVKSQQETIKVTFNPQDTLLCARRKLTRISYHGLVFINTALVGAIDEKTPVVIDNESFKTFYLWNGNGDPTARSKGLEKNYTKITLP